MLCNLNLIGRSEIACLSYHQLGWKVRFRAYLITMLSQDVQRSICYIHNSIVEQSSVIRIAPNRNNGNQL